MTLKAAIGRAFIKAREKAGLDVMDVSRYLKCDHKLIRRMEAGSLPRDSYIDQLCELYTVKKHEILYEAMQELKREAWGEIQKKIKR